ncbi:DUF1592 domain-containing protein [Roseiconus lacunae]|uniref:DUF1592 domain-containing protein n=1 Tax=Roseiconus lacunae TaxID=2605694 RepID=UPI001359D104|nr:DUF1592 domain-containing protein [Roseiconus lacunae]
MTKTIYFAMVWITSALVLTDVVTPVSANEVASSDKVAGFERSLQSFFENHCNDCHADGEHEGGLALDELSTDLLDPAVFAKWVTIHDRVQSGEMPPPDGNPPEPEQRQSFLETLSVPLERIHRSRRSTVLRRLNRQEYQNTMNDLFGTQLELSGLLPEDARSHEFDNVGEALGLSMVHLERYMDAASKVLDAAIATSNERPSVDQISAWYKDTREAEKHVGSAWKLLDDDYMVRFEGGGYPSGMLRNTNVERPGRYRIRITGYAYQSDQPVTFSVGGTSFAAGSEKPIYGYFRLPPGEPTTIELEAWIERRYMIAIEPHGITHPNRYKQASIDEHAGPGLAIGEVFLEGPLLEQFPSRGHQLIFSGIDRQEVMPRNPRDRLKRWYVPKFSIEADEPNSLARKSLRRVADAVMRKPMKEEALSPYVDLFSQRMQDGESIEQSLRTAITALLCSPGFLYFQESPGRLDDHAIANRLSYFLHRTCPDETLDALARESKLTADGELRIQTERLMNSPRFERFLVDFSNSWLDLREIDFTAPDQKLFPEYDPFLRHSMPLETLAFLREVIESNLPARSLVAPEFAMLNERLAEHYGLENADVRGTQIRKVTLPNDSIRGGLLAQASILKVTANGTNTSPVTRGAWVMERIAGVTPPPPPPGIPGVEPDIRGATTLRELLDKHRNADNCRACHQKIDPPGFAMESFNPIGGYRERYRSLGEGERIDLRINNRRVAYKLGPPVDPSGQLAGGEAFSGFTEFQKLLAEQDRMLARTFVTKLLTFACGREMGFSDRSEIERIVESTSDQQYPLQELLHAVIASDIFHTK